jgi:hypothetical protein
MDVYGKPFPSHFLVSVLYLLHTFPNLRSYTPRRSAMKALPAAATAETVKRRQLF